jgi:hypothetical protein
VVQKSFLCDLCAFVVQNAFIFSLSTSPFFPRFSWQHSPIRRTFSLGGGGGGENAYGVAEASGARGIVVGASTGALSSG